MSPDEITAMDLTELQLTWYHRLQKVVADRELAGACELCPTCWRPIDQTGWELSPFTGRPPCECGTVPLLDLPERLTIHGIDVPMRYAGARMGGAPRGLQRVD